MDGTYFELLPIELLCVILSKLSHKPELYSVLYALKLDEGSSNLKEDYVFYNLSQGLTDVFKGIGHDIKLGTRKIKWQCVYEDLIESMYSYQMNIDYAQILYNIRYPSELLLLMLYEAELRPEAKKIRDLCHILENETSLIDGKLFFCGGSLKRIFELGKTYTKEILSKMKYDTDSDTYTDDEGFKIKVDPSLSSVDLIVVKISDIPGIIPAEILRKACESIKSKGYVVRRDYES
jgi:hypothetical protein